MRSVRQSRLHGRAALAASASRAEVSLALALLGLCACAPSRVAADSGAQTDRPPVIERTVERTVSGLDEAALAPLADLNLLREAIPDRLEALASPYDPVADASCTGLATEVAALDAILGADADSPVTGGPDDLGEKASKGASDAALDAVESTTTGVIPFRGLVRMATGASAHERRLRAAFDRGARRRSFLKGLGLAQGCAPPASPLPPVAPQERIEYRGQQP